MGECGYGGSSWAMSLAWIIFAPGKYSLLKGLSRSMIKDLLWRKQMFKHSKPIMRKVMGKRVQGCFRANNEEITRKGSTCVTVYSHKIETKFCTSNSMESGKHYDQTSMPQCIEKKVAAWLLTIVWQHKILGLIDFLYRCHIVQSSFFIITLHLQFRKW